MLGATEGGPIAEGQARTFDVAHALGVVAPNLGAASPDHRQTPQPRGLVRGALVV